MVCLSSYSQAKGIKCTYVSTWNVTDGVLKLKENLRDIMLERMQTDHKVYSLTVANGQSIMVKEPESVDKMPLTVDVQRLYMDLNDSVSVKQSMYMDKLYVVKERLKTINWNIEKKQERVLGYTCYKATCKNENGENVAWFTTEIPISHAPLGFYGLPGLVIRIATPVYTLDLKDIVEVNHVKIEAPQKGISMTKDNFQKLKRGDFQELVRDKTVKLVE